MENKNTLTPPPIKGNPLKDFINSNYLKPEPHKIGAQTAAGVNKELDRSFEVPKSQYLKGLTTFGYENMGDVQANNQSTLDVVGNATGKLLSNAFTGAAESTVGTVFGVVNALVEWDYSKLYENAFTKNVIDPINKAANEAMPIYQTEVQKNAPFFSKEYLTSGGFWGDGVVASTGYTVGSILGGWALGAATGLTKGAKIAEEVASAASKGESISNNILQQAKKLNNLDTGRQIMLGTMMGAGESAQQTRQATEALKQYYQDYNKKMVDEGHPELVYDSGEIEKLVNRSGILTYGINLALTAGTDIAQLGRFIKPTWEAEKIAKNQIIKNAQGQLVDATLEKTFLNNTVVKGLGNFAKKGAPELLQEFGQTATDVSVQNYLKKRDDKEANSTIDDIITSVIEGMVSTASSKEGLTGMFAGLLGGGAFGMIGAGKERTQKQTNTAKAIATLNTDPEFKMALQTKIGDYVRIQAFNQDEDKATDNGDKLAAKNAKSNAFIATVKSHIDSGTVENLKERVKLLQKSDDKSFEDAFGFTEAGQKVDAGQRHKITQDLIDKIENIEKMDQAIQVKYSGNFDIKTSPLKWAANRELMAQLLFSAANIDNVDEREKSLSADIYKLTGLSYQNTRGFQDENLIEDTEKAFGKANKSFVAKWGKVDGDYRAGYEKSSEYREYVQTKSEFDNAREEKELNDAYITDFAKQLEKVNPLKAVEAKNAIVDINRLKEQREKLIHLYNELNNPKTLNTIVEETKKVEDEETEESKPSASNKNDRAQDDTEDAINDRREAELEPFKQAIVDNENLTPEEEEKILESIDEINTRYNQEITNLKNSKKQQSTNPGRAKVVYNGKEVEGQLMTTPQGTTIVKYKEGNKTVNIVVTKNTDGSYSVAVPVSKKNEDTTNNTPETIVTNVVSEVVSSGLADPTNIATEETQADIIQNVKEEYEIGETIVGERVGSTQPGIVMMRQYFHNFIPKLLGNGQKFFQFFFTKGKDGLPILDNTTGINTAVVNSPNGIKEGDKVVYKIFTTTNTELKKSIEDNVKGISENSKGNKRGFHESIGIYTESGELVGMYPLPQNVDKSISKSSKGVELEAARQENIKERLAILDKLAKGEEASTTIQIKTSGTLITKTLGGLANYTDNSGNTRSVGNNIVVREQDKVGGLSVYVVNDGSKLLLPYGYKGDREALESELGSFGNWGRKGQVFMLVKSANGSWYPVPVTSNKVTKAVADKVIEALKNTDLDSIIAAINPYVFATLSNTKKGAVLVDIQDTDASFTIKKEIFYLSDIKEGKNIAKFKEALMKLNQNIEVKNLNTKAAQEEAKSNETITTNAWTDLDGNYLVQPKMIVNPIREISEVQEEETDEQGNPITTITLSDINGTTDTKADIERRRQELEKTREVNEIFDVTKSIPEDSKEIQDKIKEINSLDTKIKQLDDLSKKETNEDRKIELNTKSQRLGEQQFNLRKQVIQSREVIKKNLPIIQATSEAISKGRELLNKLKLAAKSNEWNSSMPISNEDFNNLNDAVKRLGVRQSEVTSNEELANDIEIVDKINAKYDAELAALDNKGTTTTASENEKGKPERATKGKIDSIDEDEYGENPADKPMFTAKKDFKQENTKEFKAWLKNTLPQFGLTIADFAKVKGLSSRSYGQFRNMMIYLNTTAPSGTGFHEAFHGVFRNLLTEDEQVELLQEAKKKYSAPTAQELSALEQHYKKEYNITFTKKQLSDLYYEEKLADDFADYSETFNSKSLSQKIKDFFNKILNWFGIFTQTNQSKIDTLFNSVNAGKFKTKAPLFNSKKFQPVDKKIDEENMSAYVQDMLVTNLLGQYTNSLFTKLSNGISLESTRLNYDIFNEIYQYHKGLKTENKLKPKQKDINNLILYHFDAFSDEVVKALAQRGIDTKRDFTVKEGNLVPGLDSEINASENKDSKGYGEQVRISGFSTASPRLKLFLSDIQAIDTKGNPKTFLGKPVYVDMTNLYYYLEENLVGINTYQEQIKELEKLSEFRPEIKNVIDKLQNTPSAIYSTKENQNKRRAEQIRIQNDFKTNFSKQHLGFRLVKFSTDHATGKTTFEVMGSNRQDFGREIYTEWTDALLDPNRITTTKHDTVKNKQTGAIERDIQQFGTTKAKALNVKVGKLLEKMLPTKDKNGKLVPSKHTPDIDDVTDMFRLVGIDFDEKVIQDNLTNPKLYKDFKAYTAWLASTTEEQEKTVSIEKLGKKGLSELVNYQVKSMYKGYTTSFNNVENKAVYAIQLPTFQSKLFDKLIGSNKDAEISLLERDNFLKGNLILEDLKTEYSETGFQFTAIDGLKNTKNSKEGVKFTAMTDKDMMASNIAMFQNKAVNAAKKGTSKEKIAIIPYLIPADKSMLYYFDVISRNFNIYTDPEKGVTVDPNSASIKHFINRVKAETERMKSALKDKENFYKGELKIEDLFENYHYTGDALKNFNKIKDTLSPAEYKEAVEKLFNGRAFKFNYFLNEDREFLDKELLSLVHTDLIQEGTISKSTEARLKASLVKELTEEVQRTIKNVTKEGLTEDSLSIAKGKFNEVIGNYALNRFLYNIELSVLLNGDEAFYKPGDLAKRTTQSGAFTTSNNTNPNDSFKVQVVKDVEESTPSAAILREITTEKVAAEYDKVNLTDAQLIMTPEATRKMLDARGTWTDAHEEAFKIAETTTNPDKIPYKYRAILSAQKIFVYGLVWNEKLQRYVPSQIKCSVMTAHKVLAVDNEVLRDFRERSTAEGFHVLTYKSAFKAAMPFAANVENYNGEGVISIPEEFFGFQQDNPDHLLDAENDSLRQSQMLLPALASEKNRAQLLELQAANIKESTEKLGKELANPEDFNRIVQDSLTKRATTENVVKSLAMSPDSSFKIGLDTGFTSTSAENLISSLFTNNIIKQKFKGGSGVQASALGFQFKNLKEQQVAVEGNKELKTLQTSLEYKYNIDNKSLEYVECALPAWASEFFNEDGFLRSDVPDNLKELFCYRIPTEGAHSMLPLRVVKFLPEVIGNYIILPGEITKQFGADFDFDKIYFIAPEFTKDKQTGKLSKIEYDYNKSVSENSREARNNRILEIYIETLQDAANLEMVMTPSGFEDLTYFKEHILKIKNPLKNYYLGSTQDGLRERNHTAAAIKGQSNLHVTGHAYSTLLQLDSQTYNKQGEKTSSGTLEIDGNKQTNYSSKRSIDGKYIADELSQILAASLDDWKNPILAYLNLTKDTIDVACTFVRAGFGITRMEHLMTQPIIFELAEELKTNQQQIKKDINSKPFTAEDLLLAYQVKLNSILGNLNIDVGDYEQKQKYKGGGITVKEMIEWKKRTNFNISKTDAQANYDLAEYYQGQIKVLSQYNKAEKISNGLKDLNRFFAINKEVGPNFENIIQQVDRYNIINSSEFPVKGFNISNIPALEAIYGAQLEAVDFLSRHFPYNSSLYNTIKNRVAELVTRRDKIINKELEDGVVPEARTTKSKLTPENRMLINGFTGAFISQLGNIEGVPSMFSSLTKEERERILEQVPKDLIKLAKDSASVKNNPFIKNLKNSFDKKSNTMFSKTRGNRLDVNKKDLASDGFMDLWNNPETRPFAEDLMKYSFITTGLFSGLHSFHQLFPTDAIVESGYADFKKTVLQKLNNESYTLTRAQQALLTDQLVRNFPDAFIKNVNKEGLTSDIKKELPNQIFITITEESKKHLNSIILDTIKTDDGFDYILAKYFKVFDKVKKDFIIYREIAPNSYEQVVKLGVPGSLIEMDTNNDIKVSIITKNKLTLKDEAPKEMSQEQEELYNQIKQPSAADENNFANENYETPTIDDEPVNDFLDNNNLAAQEEETQVPESTQSSTSVENINSKKVFENLISTVPGSKANINEILNTAFTNDKGFNVLPEVGIMIKPDALTSDQINYFLQLIKNSENDAFYANVGKDANVMLVPEGKMWDQKQHYTVSGIYADKSPVESKNTKVENNSAYSYYETDKEGNLLKPVSKETLDILSSLFGDNLNNIIDATIGNVYFRNTGIGLHKDTTEPNNNVGVYGVVLGNSYDLQITTQETNNPKYGAGAGTEINLEMKQGTVYKFGLNDDKGNITGRFITHRPVGNVNTEVKSSNIKLPELNLPEVKKARYKQTSTIIPATTIDQYGLSITYRSVIEKNDIPKGQIKSDYTKQEAVQPTAPSTSVKEGVKRGSMISFQLEEYQVERVTDEGYDVRSAKTGDTEFLTKEEYDADNYTGVKEKPINPRQITKETKDDFTCE